MRYGDDESPKMAKKIVKKVTKHLKGDGKDYRKGIREDIALKGKLKKMVKSKKSKED